MKIRTMLAIPVLVISCFSNAFAGDKGGNGGDSHAQFAKSRLTTIFGSFSKAYGDHMVVKEHTVPLSLIMNLLKKTRVQMVKGPIIENGQPVDMRNLPAQNLIEIDEARWGKIRDFDALIIHEMLGLVRTQMNDLNYDFSPQLKIIYERTFLMAQYPFDTAYMAADRAWAEAKFIDADEAGRFVTARDCSVVGFGSYDLNPGVWTSDLTVTAVKVFFNQDPLGNPGGFAIGITPIDAQGASQGHLENGKWVSRFIQPQPIMPSITETTEASAGLYQGKLVVKVREAYSDSGEMYEKIMVCTDIIVRKN